MLYDAQIPEGDSVLVGLAGRRVQWATPKAEKSTIILGGNCHQGGSASSTPSTVEVAISTESFEVAVSKDGNMVRDCPSPIQTRKKTHTHTHTHILVVRWCIQLAFLDFYFSFSKRDTLMLDLVYATRLTIRLRNGL